MVPERRDERPGGRLLEGYESGADSTTRTRPVVTRATTGGWISRVGTTTARSRASSGRFRGPSSSTRAAGAHRAAAGGRSDGATRR